MARDNTEHSSAFARQDLHWYTRDKKSKLDLEVAKAEIQKIKEEEEEAMCEALGLAPKRTNRPQSNRLDKHEFLELVKRGSTAEDLGAGHAEAAQVQGLGFSRATRNWGESSSLAATSIQHPSTDVTNGRTQPDQALGMNEEASSEDGSRKKRKHKEKKHRKHEKRESRHSPDLDKVKHSHDLDEKKKHRRGQEKKRHKSH